MGYLHYIYYYSSWKSLTYRWLKAYFAVYRWFGLKARRCFSKSRASSLAPGNICVNVFFFGIFVLEMMLEARGESIDSMSFWEGLPVNYSIL